MSGLFLSHSYKDKGFVRLLAYDLRTAGVQVWHDEDEIVKAESHVRKIEIALGDAGFVGACLSPNSVSSNWVKTEIDVAVAREINEGRVVVLPLLIKDCQIPLMLTAKAFLDFRSPAKYESEFQNLLRAMRREVTPEIEVDEIFTMDCARKQLLVAAAKLQQSAQGSEPSSPDWVRDWILDYLIDEKSRSYDGSERHWVYFAMAEIGGERAEAALQRALSDEEEFARRGAEKALKLLGVGS